MLSNVSPQFAEGTGCASHDVYNFAESFNYGMVCLHDKKPALSRKGEPVLAFQILYLLLSEISGEVVQLCTKKCRTRAFAHPGADRRSNLLPAATCRLCSAAGCHLPCVLIIASRLDFRQNPHAVANGDGGV